MPLAAVGGGAEKTIHKGMPIPESKIHISYPHPYPDQDTDQGRLDQAKFPPLDMGVTAYVRRLFYSEYLAVLTFRPFDQQIK